MATINTEDNPDQSAEISGRWGRKLLCAVTALLAAAFLFRTCQYGFLWATHASSPDFNYKALTLWAGLYTFICGAIALAAYPRTLSAEDQKAERGT